MKKAFRFERKRQQTCKFLGFRVRNYGRKPVHIIARLSLGFASLRSIAQIIDGQEGWVVAQGRGESFATDRVAADALEISPS